MKKNNLLKNKSLSYKIAYYLIICLVAVTLIFSWLGGLFALTNLFNNKTTTVYADEQINKSAVDIYAPLPTFYSLVNSSNFVAYNEEICFTIDLTNDTISATIVDTTTLKQPIDSSGNILNNTSVTFSDIYSTFGGILSVRDSNNTFNYTGYLRSFNDLILNPIPDLVSVTNITASYYNNYVTYNITCLDYDLNNFAFNLSFNPTAPLAIDNYGSNVIFYSNNVNLTTDLSYAQIENIKHSSYDAGYNAGKNVADNVQYQNGYNAGLADSAENGGFTFYTLVDSIFFGGYNFIYNLLNFEFLGFNMFGVFTFVASAGLLGVILRFVI